MSCLKLCHFSTVAVCMGLFLTCKAEWFVLPEFSKVGNGSQIFILEPVWSACVNYNQSCSMACHQATVRLLTASKGKHAREVKRDFLPEAPFGGKSAPAELQHKLADLYRRHAKSRFGGSGVHTCSAAGPYMAGLRKSEVPVAPVLIKSSFPRRRRDEEEEMKRDHQVNIICSNCSAHIYHHPHPHDHHHHHHHHFHEHSHHHHHPSVIKTLYYLANFNRTSCERFKAFKVCKETFRCCGCKKRRRRKRSVNESREYRGRHTVHLPRIARHQPAGTLQPIDLAMAITVISLACAAGVITALGVSLLLLVARKIGSNLYYIGEPRPSAHRQLIHENLNSNQNARPSYGKGAISFDHEQCSEECTRRAEPLPVAKQYLPRSLCTVLGLEEFGVKNDNGEYDKGKRVVTEQRKVPKSGLLDKLHVVPLNLGLTRSTRKTSSTSEAKKHSQNRKPQCDRHPPLTDRFPLSFITKQKREHLSNLTHRQQADVRTAKFHADSGRSRTAPPAGSAENQTNAAIETSNRSPAVRAEKTISPSANKNSSALPSDPSDRQNCDLQVFQPLEIPDFHARKPRRMSFGMRQTRCYVEATSKGKSADRFRKQAGDFGCNFPSTHSVTHKHTRQNSPSFITVPRQDYSKMAGDMPAKHKRSSSTDHTPTEKSEGSHSSDKKSMKQSTNSSSPGPWSSKAQRGTSEKFAERLRSIQLYSEKLKRLNLSRVALRPEKVRFISLSSPAFFYPPGQSQAKKLNRKLSKLSLFRERLERLNLPEVAMKRAKPDLASDRATASNSSAYTPSNSDTVDRTSHPSQTGSRSDSMGSQTQPLSEQNSIASTEGYISSCTESMPSISVPTHSGQQESTMEGSACINATSGTSTQRTPSDVTSGGRKPATQSQGSSHSVQKRQPRHPRSSLTSRVASSHFDTFSGYLKGACSSHFTPSSTLVPDETRTRDARQSTRSSVSISSHTESQAIHSTTLPQTEVDNRNATVQSTATKSVASNDTQIERGSEEDQKDRPKMLDALKDIWLQGKEHGHQKSIQLQKTPPDLLNNLDSTQEDFHRRLLRGFLNNISLYSEASTSSSSVYISRRTSSTMPSDAGLLVESVDKLPNTKRIEHAVNQQNSTVVSSEATGRSTQAARPRWEQSLKTPSLRSSRESKAVVSRESLPASSCKDWVRRQISASAIGGFDPSQAIECSGIPIKCLLRPSNRCDTPSATKWSTCKEPACRLKRVRFLHDKALTFLRHSDLVVQCERVPAMGRPSTQQLFIFCPESICLPLVNCGTSAIIRINRQSSNVRPTAAVGRKVRTSDICFNRTRNNCGSCLSYASVSYRHPEGGEGNRSRDTIRLIDFAVKPRSTQHTTYSPDVDLALAFVTRAWSLKSQTVEVDKKEPICRPPDRNREVSFVEPAPSDRVSEESLPDTGTELSSGDTGTSVFTESSSSVQTPSQGSGCHGDTESMDTRGAKKNSINNYNNNYSSTRKRSGKDMVADAFTEKTPLEVSTGAKTRKERAKVTDVHVVMPAAEHSRVTSVGADIQTDESSVSQGGPDESLRVSDYQQSELWQDCQQQEPSESPGMASSVDSFQTAPTHITRKQPKKRTVGKRAKEGAGKEKEQRKPLTAGAIWALNRAKSMIGRRNG